MIISTYKLTTYTDYLHQLASLLGTTFANNQFQIPEAAGSGFFRVIQLGNGLEAILYDFTLKDTLVLRREQENREYYTLVFDELEREHGFHVKIDAESGEAVDRPTAFYLTSFLYDVETVLQKNVNVKGVRFLLMPDWMQQYLQLNQNEAVVEKYIALKTAGVWYKPVTSEQITLLHELLELH